MNIKLYLYTISVLAFHYIVCLVTKRYITNYLNQSIIDILIKDNHV